MVPPYELSDEHALTEFAKQYLQADLQRLRLLIRNAQKEKAAEEFPVAVSGVAGDYHCHMMCHD